MVILYLKCGHRLVVTEDEAKRVKVGHLAYCNTCNDLVEVTGKS